MTTDPRFLINHVCAALDQRLEQLPADTQARLAAARQVVLASRAQVAQMAPVRTPVPAGLASSGDKNLSGFSLGGWWRSGLSAGLPLLIALAGIFGVYQLEQQHHFQEMAELDTMMLTDELPPSAYADRGFNVYLSNRGS